MGKKNRQHIIPATLISNFSNENRIDARKNNVFVKFRSTNEIKNIAAEKIIKENHFYTIIEEKEYNNIVDNTWTNVEKKFKMLCNSLCSINYDVNIIKSSDFILLVEFVTQLLVRGKAFTRNYLLRQEKMLKGDKFTEQDKINNMNFSRLFELMRLRPYILYANFVIYRAPKDISFLNNDEGFLSYARFDNPEIGGIAIPISKDLILGIDINKNLEEYDYSKKISELKINKGKYIEYRVLNLESAKDFNKHVGIYAEKLIFGPYKKYLDEINLKDYKENIYGMWYSFLTNEMQKNISRFSRDHEQDFNMVIGGI